MGKEQELLDDETLALADAADGLWSALLPLMQAGEPDVYQRKVKALQIIRAAITRRSSDEQAEVVGWVTADILAAMKRGERVVPGWKRSADFCIPLYASPPAVAAGGVTEALRSAMGMCERYADFIRRVPAAEIEQHPYLPELEQVIEVARAHLAVRDEGIREGWQDIATAPKDRTPVIIAVPNQDQTSHFVGEAYFDPENYEGGDWWWAGTGYGDYHAGPISDINHHQPTHWQPLPTPPSRGEGV